jgi:MOSC domain-containing protein YiiM
MNVYTEIDLPIGCRFIIGNVYLEVTAATLCNGCYYAHNRHECRMSNLDCFGSTRADGKSVVFKKIGNVLKVEES